MDTMVPALHPGLGGDDQAPSEPRNHDMNNSAPRDHVVDSKHSSIRRPHHPHQQLHHPHQQLYLQDQATSIPPALTVVEDLATSASSHSVSLEDLRNPSPFELAAEPSSPASSAATSIETVTEFYGKPQSDAVYQHQQFGSQLHSEPHLGPHSRAQSPSQSQSSKSQSSKSQSSKSQSSKSQSQATSVSQSQSHSPLDPGPDSPSQIDPAPQLPSSPGIAPRPTQESLIPSTYPHGSVPAQTIIKALASIPSAPGLLGNLAAPSLPNDMCPSGGTASSSVDESPQILADALRDLAKKRAAPTTAIASMLSPCFYHQRFDDAVDIDRVLDEMQSANESMSHSRLAQTATSVREISKQLQRRPIRRAVRSVMIVTKARDNQLVYYTRELAIWLLQTPRYGSDVGVNVYVDAKLRASKRFDANGILALNPRFNDMLKYWTPDLCWSQPEKFDLVLTLGGDGTVLFTSWLFQRIVPPVLSFSLGSLGFMTTFEFDYYRKHLDRVMGDYGMKINLRMRFTCTVWRQCPEGSKGPVEANGGPMMDEGEQFEVLNELVIDRGPSPYVSNLELYGDDELLTVVQADGCIFSTPTGSTAYSLSAGGSLVHPDIPAILLTPICPHTLSFRPMVLSDTMALRVAVPRNSRATAYCAFDGKGRIELRQGDHVTITASQYPFPTVTRTDTEWFDSVSRTLRWNVRAAAQKPFDCPAVSSENGDDEDDAGWDIDADSAYYASEEGSEAASPVRRQMSMLEL